ncbi:MAG: glycosyltransferase family 4 protein [Flavobacteriales bacterium]
MRIGINTRFLLPTKMEGFGWYTYEICRRITEQHPEHEFYFFFDRPFEKKFVFGANVIPVVISPPARHPFLFIYWFEIGIRSALKKYKIDLFFSPDGYLSLGSKVPQVGVIHDINFEHFPKDLPFSARAYLRYFFPKFAAKASHIITVSNYSKEDISRTYDIDSEKITAIWNGVSNVFRPLAEKEKEKVREKYTLGNPYFLFVGAIHPRKNVKRLIEAFSLFKQLNDSPIRLLIVGESLWKNFTEEFELSDEIEDSIRFTGHLSPNELSRVMASADLFTYVSYFEGFGIPLVEAMKCGTPILSGNRTSLPEVAGDAAMYCDPFDVSDIAEKMKRITSDVQIKASLSTKGLERSLEFSWDKAAQEVWKVLMKSYDK